MIPLPINAFTSTGLYFNGFLFAASVLLLLALYLVRWKSESLSTALWLGAHALAALGTWLITDDAIALIPALALNFLLLLTLRHITPITSTFGLFFAVIMVAPAVYALVWLFELLGFLIGFEGIGWGISLVGICLAFIFSVLIVANSTMGTWITLVRFSELYFLFPRGKAAEKLANAPRTSYPWVSIHVPCYAEPPELVIKTLDALAALEYPNFEVIVIDNNTKEVSLWKPLEERCTQLGERFRFYHVDPLQGAKAGALNLATTLTSPQVEVIAVIDADFVVQPDFLARNVGYFDNPKTGFVQTCHDYRDWQKSRYQTACYYEYEVHFKLELPGLSEWDTAYTVGTMCLVRRRALESAGGWSEWCLTEDSELAVRLHALGYEGYNLKETFGRGIIPETFEGYKKQRFRWSAGPVQQIQQHWRLYLPWAKNSLRPVQKIAEIFHSMSLFFSELMYVAFNLPILLVFVWLSITKGLVFPVPTAVLVLIPVAILRNIICNRIHVGLLGGGWREYVLSAMALRSLGFTRLKAFYMAWLPVKLAWKRTDKFPAKSCISRAFLSCRGELILVTLYLVIAAFIAPYADFSHPDVLCLTFLGFLNQALTFLCAPLMALYSERELAKGEREQVPLERFV